MSFLVVCAAVASPLATAMHAADKALAQGGAGSGVQSEASHTATAAWFGEDSPLWVGGPFSGMSFPSWGSVAKQTPAAAVAHTTTSDASEALEVVNFNRVAVADANSSSDMKVPTKLDFTPAIGAEDTATKKVLQALANVETDESKQSDELRKSNGSAPAGHNHSGPLAAEVLEVALSASKAASKAAAKAKTAAAAKAKTAAAKKAPAKKAPAAPKVQRTSAKPVADTNQLLTAEREAAKAITKLDSTKGKEKKARRHALDMNAKLRKAQALEKKQEVLVNKTSEKLKGAHLTKMEMSAKMKSARATARKTARKKSAKAKVTTAGVNANGTLASAELAAERKINAATRTAAMKSAEQKVRAEVEKHVEDVKKKLDAATKQLENARSARMKAEAEYKAAAARGTDLHFQSLKALKEVKDANRSRLEAFKEAKKKTALVLKLQEKEKELTKAHELVVNQYKEAKAAWLKAQAALNHTTSLKAVAAPSSGAPSPGA